MQSVLAFALAIEAVLAASSSSTTVAAAASSSTLHLTATRPTASLIEPTLTSILAVQATATSLSPVSNVKGAGFDRFVQIWLENTVRY